VAVKIKLMRMGKIRAPYYRIVVADARTKRDGRAIETIGKYHPTEEPSLIEVDSSRAQYWLGVGAQPTEAVAAIFKVTGDWQKFRGEPGAEGTLKVAAAKADKKAVFEAAAKEAGVEPQAEATTPRAKKAVKKAEPVEAVATEAAPEAPADAAAEAAPEAAPEAPADAAAEAATEAAAEAPAEAPADAAAEAPAEVSADTDSAEA
jgi:small subunit ribosomal protein S16